MKPQFGFVKVSTVYLNFIVPKLSVLIVLYFTSPESPSNSQERI